MSIVYSAQLSWVPKAPISCCSLAFLILVVCDFEVRANDIDPHYECRISMNFGERPGNATKCLDMGDGATMLQGLGLATCGQDMKTWGWYGMCAVLARDSAEAELVQSEGDDQVKLRSKGHKGLPK